MSDDRTAVAEEEDIVDEQEIEDEQPADEGEPEADEGAEPAEDEPEAEAEPAEGEEEVEDAPRPRKGASETIRALRERAQRAERERDEARSTAQPRPQEQPRETPQQREERLALMDPDQRTQYLLNEQRFHFDGRQTALERYVVGETDKSSFTAECARKPHFAALADKVEAEFQRLFKQGQYVPRATLAKYIWGDEMDKRAAGHASQQRRRGKERIAGQRTRPTGGRSDVTAERRTRGDTAAAREARLKDQEL